ncbi:MAG: hypothetical protein DA407_06120 [Bacteroidetes bacterium]|nr:MAG: hypothetical protein DA407_06120 [Bacteroidota bacterium]
MRVGKLFIVICLLSFTKLFSQSLENLEGTYLVEQDGIIHSFEFRKNKLFVSLNINDFYHEKYTYSYWCILNDDNTLKVSLIDIQMETIDLKGIKKNKSRSVATHSLTIGNFWSEWTLEKVEENKLFIKVEPRSIKWPFSDQWLESYYSGFENSFVLKPNKKID